MLDKNKVRDIMSKIRDLGTDICNNMLELDLDVDDWFKISRYLDRIEKIIKIKEDSLCQTK